MERTQNREQFETFAWITFVHSFVARTQFALATTEQHCFVPHAADAARMLLPQLLLSLTFSFFY